MAAYKPVRAIEVRLWGRRVGAVALDPKLGYYAFEYDPDWIACGVELAPRAMPLSAATQPFVFTALPEATFRRLPALLADALPDEFGNRLIDAWLADHGVAHAAITPLDRLAYMGKRGVGALEFRPERAPARKPVAVELGALVEEARRAVRGRIDRADAATTALRQLIEVGTSAGGARAKAVVAWNPTTDELRSGQFEAPAGFEHWLLKFDGLGTDAELGQGGDYGRIEFAYHLMARRAGIDMMPCRLLEEGGRAHFMTRRFDREAGAKVHVQTLCALAHLDLRLKATHSYRQWFEVMDELALGYEAKLQGFRRMAFNVMARNCDDHTKNFAFLRREGGGWELAPAYDVTHAYNPHGEWTHQHQMSVAGRFDGIDRAALFADATALGLGEAPKVLDEVAAAVAAWPEFAREAGLGAEVARRIGAEHRRL